MTVTCPKCRRSFAPYGSYMLEKCHCPYCGYTFQLLHGGTILRILYLIACFSSLMLMYILVRPETSIVIALFWLCAIAAIKLGTYLLHLILLFLWRCVSRLRNMILGK